MSVMTSDDIQCALDEICQKATDKGLKTPSMSLIFNSHETAPMAWMKYDDGSDWGGMSTHRSKDCEQSLRQLADYVDQLPTKAETDRQNFMKAVSRAINLGRETGIEIEYIAPLMEAMKALSENAITHQKEAKHGL